MTATDDGARKAPSSVRPFLVGTDIQYPAGTTLRRTLRGYNWGAYATVVLPGDVAQCISDGAKIVRVVGNNRWFGEYSGFAPGTDSRNDNAFVKYDTQHWTDLKAIVRQLTNAGIWVVVTFDSNCAINNVASEATFCTANVGGVGAWPNGYNVYTSGDLFGYVRAIWQMIANEFASYPYIFAYELGAEPANSLDATWVDDLLVYYRTVADDVKRIDPLAKFIVGGRAYSVANFGEILMAERTDCIYTWNALDGGLTNTPVLPGNTDAVCAFAEANSIPFFMNQMGSRRSSDPNDEAMLAGGAIMNSRGIIWTWWQAKDWTVSNSNYGLRYNDGAGGFIDKTIRIANFTAMANRTLAALESAAQAAATAESAVLHYVKPDFSNCWQDSAGTTPVTAAGQPLGLMTPVIGSGLNLLQSTAGARPTVIAAATVHLIDQRPVMSFDAVNTYLTGSVAFFSSGSQMTVIASGIPANVSSTQDFVVAGGSGGNPKWPRLGASAGKAATSVWQSDTTTNTVTGTTGTGAYPLVMSCTRDGSANKKLFVNGLQDGATNSTADGAIASFTRFRVGSGTSNAPTFSGPIALICVKVGTMSDANRQAIERFAAYLVGAGYQL